MGWLKRRGVVAGMMSAAAAPAVAETIRLGPPVHDKGPLVFLDYDQIELDAAYDQAAYAPLLGQIIKRYASLSAATRVRRGQPERFAYGPTPIEKLDLFRGPHATAPAFVFIHGGAWLSGTADMYAFPAEMFFDAGAHYIALDFVSVKDAGGNLAVMAEQIRRAVGWIYHNAAQLGVDPGQIYLGGHSSGGHLCGVALVTDWAARGLPDNIVKAGLCMSGLYEMLPVRLSKRSAYLKFTPESEAAMSAIRQLDRLRVPVTVTYGGDETPEFQRQSREFAKASNATLIAVPDHNHFEMALTLGDPYGANGRAALGMMGLRTASSTRSQ